VTLSYRAVPAAVLIAATLVLSGCGEGFSAQVDDIRADNAAGQAHDVLARAIVLVKGQAATAAAMAGTLINAGNRSDQLQTITLTDTAPGSTPITLTPNLTLEPGQLISLGNGNTPPITVPGASALRVGDFIDVVLHFRNAGDIPLQVACVDRTNYFSDVLPTTTPEPTQNDTTSKATSKKAGQVATATKPADKP
jgi:copper(I)-binding protein